MTRNVALIIFLTCVHTLANSQNVPGSPYSYFGIGDIYYKGFGKQQIVGGTGIGARDPYSLNNLNPASYTNFLGTSMITELGLQISTGISNNGETSDGIVDMEFPYLSMGFRTGRNSGMSVGMRKYSNVAYQIVGESSFSGVQGDYEIAYEGFGGLNEIYFGYARKFWNRLSLGFHGAYIFGALNNNQQILSTDLGYNLGIEDENFLSGFNLDFGLQLEVPIRKSEIVIGATFDPASGLNESREIIITNIIATTRSVEDTLVTSSYSDLGYSLPDAFGLGASWTFRNKLRVSTDFSTQLWSQVNLDGENFKLTNSERYAVGIEHLPDYRNDNWFERINYGVGIYQLNSYLLLENNQLTSRGVSAGFGFPLRNKAIMRFTYEYISRGNEKDSLKDNFSKFSVSISLLEAWFVKRKYN